MPARRFKLWPIKIVLLDKLLAFIKAFTETPYFLARLHKVSPFTTVWVVEVVSTVLALVVLVALATLTALVDLAGICSFWPT